MLTQYIGNNFGYSVFSVSLDEAQSALFVTIELEQDGQIGSCWHDDGKCTQVPSPASSDSKFVVVCDGVRTGPEAGGTVDVVSAAT